jgi:hypothetical protein
MSDLGGLSRLLIDGMNLCTGRICTSRARSSGRGVEFTHRHARRPRIRDFDDYAALCVAMEERQDVQGQFVAAGTCAGRALEPAEEIFHPVADAVVPL